MDERTQALKLELSSKEIHEIRNRFTIDLRDPTRQELLKLMDMAQCYAENEERWLLFGNHVK